MTTHHLTGCLLPIWAATVLAGCASTPSNDLTVLPADCRQQQDDYRDYGARRDTRVNGRNAPDTLGYTSMVSGSCRDMIKRGAR